MLLSLIPIVLLLIHGQLLSGLEIPGLESQILKFPSVEDVLKIPLHFVGGVPTLSFGVGTPTQPVTGVFDTGSLMTWIMSDQCNSSVCTGVANKFHRKESSTNHDLGYTIEIDYIDGSSVRLLPELDKLTLLDDIVIPEHLMAEAIEVYYPKTYPTSANGRLGVGDFGAFIKYVANLEGVIKDKTGLLKGILTRAVGDDRTATGYAASGSPDFKKRDGVHAPFYWTLGSDPSMHDESDKLYNLRLMSPSAKVLSPYWKLPLHGIKLVGQVENAVNDTKKEDQPTQKKASLLSSPLIKRAPSPSPSSSSSSSSELLLRLDLPNSAYGSIDSSTPYLHLPRKLSQALNQKLGAEYDSSLELYTIPCDRKADGAPLLVFEFEGVDALLPAHQYIIKKNQKCHTAILDNIKSKNNNDDEDEDQIHLGGPFFRSYYIEYYTAERKVAIAESPAKLGLLRETSVDGSYHLTSLIDKGLDVLSSV
ncbi:aspartic peptidase domain-containing protein [Absidia repens]|uniref:Aspartic peptidase domain-containing protein n=1 Tax=Absidia repens TaxID=90262 RepID=A0A1X2J133_9FUNG|nr:aspartic peptidase domain-containing protein [Absidia repens]